MDTSKKIIKGAVNGRGFTITSPITQWDYGWQFIPEIEELPPTYRLDFSNEEKHGTALPVYCSTEGAEVPTELIDTGKDVWVWFVRIGDGFGITEYKWRVPNKCKPKTEQDEPTPSQQSSIDQLIVRSNEAVEQAEQSASDASTSAQNASADAERAEEARTDAQNYATQAQTSANNASASAQASANSATASAQSASQSAQIKADVEELERDAQAAANSSGISARASGDFASQAQGYATSASQSAASAQEYASQAQTSAQTASSKASEASTSAQTASNKASEASQSATNASQSAQTAEQAKTASQTAQGLAESARDSAVQAKTDAESAKADAESARDEAQQAVASISGALAEKAPIITDTASGAVASFHDGADDLPLKSLVVDINPIQDLSHGDPSPENLCPISGWTEVDAEQRGKNLFDVRKSSAYNHNVTLTFNDDGSMTCKNDNSYALTPTDTAVISVPNGTYMISSSSAVDGDVAFYASDDGVNYSWYANGLTPTVLNRTITINKPYVRIRWLVAGNTIATLPPIQLELGSTATPYEPYTGRSITIDLGQTVYGGHLDVLGGNMVISMVKSALPQDRVYQASNNRVIYLQSKFADVPKISGVVVSNAFKYYPNTATPPMWNVSLYSNGNIIFGIDSSVITTDTEWGTFVSENDVYVVYELATPIEIQLTPQQVNSLLGVNNIWADTGDANVEYRADTKLYISKRIAEAISALS